MAAQRIRRTLVQETRQRGPARLALLRGGQRPIARPRPIVRREPRYKRIGKIQRANSAMYNFTIRTLREINTGEKQYLIGRTSRETRRTDWRMMNAIEFRRSQNVSRKNEKGQIKIQALTTSATMLAKHPDAFLHVGHEVAKNIMHVLLAA